jgi:peroxiredoxin
MVPVVAGNHEFTFTLTDIDGNLWTKDGLRGRVTLLLFSGTWCEPCRTAEDAIADLLPGYQEKATFLGIYLPPQNAVGELADYRQARGLPFPIAADTDELQVRFAVSSIPHAAIFRANGLLEYEWRPFQNYSEESARGEIGAVLDEFVAEIPDPIQIPEVPWWLPLPPAAVVSFSVVVLLGRGRSIRPNRGGVEGKSGAGGPQPCLAAPRGSISPWRAREQPFHPLAGHCGMRVGSNSSSPRGSTN